MMQSEGSIASSSPPSFIETNPNQTPRRRRVLGNLDGLCAMISIVIGSGIFASPGVVLDRAGSPGAALVTWVAAGMIKIRKFLIS